MGEMAKVVPSSDDYILSRDFAANARLNLQHYLWKDRVGYLLHPSIQTDVEGLKVAEIGVGTGIWLVDLATTLPPSAQLDGFDIDLTQCPPKEWLPPNVSFHAQDCLAEPSSPLVGKYDVVHVQLFHLGIPNNDPVPVVRNLIQMLKPGGRLSWGEYDYKTWQIVRTGPTTKDSEDLNTLLEYTGSIGGTRPSWVKSFWPSRLPQTFENLGLSDIVVDRHPFPKDTLPYYLDTALMACEEISYNALDPLGGGQGEVARDLIKRVSKDRQNTAFNLDRLTVVGQKSTG